MSEGSVSPGFRKPRKMRSEATLRGPVLVKACPPLGPSVVVSRSYHTLPQHSPL